MCDNCISLNAKCLELKQEVISLNNKIDNLVEIVFRDKADFSCQTEPELTLTYTQTIDSEQEVTIDNPILSAISDISTLTDQHDDLLLDIFSGASMGQLVHEEVNTGLINKDTNVQALVILPYILFPNQPFAQFNVSDLIADTNFGTQLHNRSVCYYGEYKYSYSDITHKPQAIPISENYMCNIIEKLNSILPDFKFNSILLTKYNNGSDYIGYHSDDEPEIDPNSDIVTISLGENRVAKFKESSINSGYPEQSLNLKHGDLFVMSRSSQNFFQHSIVADSSVSKRVSITFHILKESSSVAQSTSIHHTSPPTASDTLCPSSPSQPQPIQTSAPQPSENYTVYIGDSMFSKLISDKMSSSSQKAYVLAYPGATAGGLIGKLKNDPNFHAIDSTKVKRMYVCCGANNADKVLNIPYHLQSEFVDTRVYDISDKALTNARNEFTHLTDVLNNWAKSASINFLNILPKESFYRNQVINLLNEHISMISNQKAFVKMVSTEENRRLFSFVNGFRKSDFFLARGEDNVHLNNSGISRLAKHLKHAAHNDL